MVAKNTNRDISEGKKTFELTTKNSELIARERTQNETNRLLLIKNKKK